jgi:hypothetical protein
VVVEVLKRWKFEYRRAYGCEKEIMRRDNLIGQGDKHTVVGQGPIFEAVESGEAKVMSRGTPRESVWNAEVISASRRVYEAIASSNRTHTQENWRGREREREREREKESERERGERVSICRHVPREQSRVIFHIRASQG